MNDLLDSKIIKDKCKYDVDIVVFDEIDSTKIWNTFIYN